MTLSIPDGGNVRGGEYVGLTLHEGRDGVLHGGEDGSVALLLPLVQLNAHQLSSPRLCTTTRNIIRSKIRPCPRIKLTILKER